MTKLKRMIKGIGSTIDILPNTNYFDYVPKENLEKRMENAWYRTGKQIKESLDNLANEKKTK